MNANATRFLAAVATSLFVAGSAAAGALEDGDAAYHEQDYAKAAELWKPLAEKGDATAQFYLGNLYAEGKGVKRDDAAAFQWFQRAADKGNASAQYNVGASYAEGVGVDKSVESAAKWFRRAADQGMVFAQLNLGLLYAAGAGVPQDSVEALKWLEIAFVGLPAGGPRMDVANAIQNVSAKMRWDQVDDAKQRARDWKAKPEAK